MNLSELWDGGKEEEDGTGLRQQEAPNQENGERGLAWDVGAHW